MTYLVYYASAGCLPDTEPIEFPTLEQASAYVIAEFDEVAALMDTDGDEAGPDVLTGFEVMAAMGAYDPRPGSLYRWSIERFVGQISDLT